MGSGLAFQQNVEMQDLTPFQPLDFLLFYDTIALECKVFAYV